MKVKFLRIFKIFLFGAIYSFVLPIKGMPLMAKPPRYQVEFRGVDSFAQLRSLKRSSTLIRHRKNSPKSLAALKYRADQDVPDFIEILHAYGYYDACISTRAFRQPSGKLKMVIAVNKGEPYILHHFDYKAFDEPREQIYDISQISLQRLGVRLNKKALSTEIVDAQKQLVSILNQNGHPFAKIEDQAIVVDQPYI